MVLRAIFWLAVVALLMPHAVGAGSVPNCRHGCSAGAQLFGTIKAAGLHSLEQVRDDIHTAEDARSRSG